MCVVVAKKIKDLGWVIAKNRDRNYKPEVSIRQSNRQGIQRLYLHDDKTRYTEGVNQYGVCILSASVMVKKDEKEGRSSDDQSERTFYSPDGFRIRTALFERSARSALRKLIELKIPGNTIIADTRECYILEGAFKNYNRPNQEYIHRWRKVKDSETVVRTNHGIALEWAGYQAKGDNRGEKAARKSSISRLKIAEREMKKAEDVEGIFKALSFMKEKDPQMNPLRFDEKSRAMRTTGQLLCIPSERTLHYRPVWCSMKLQNFDALQGRENKTFFEVLSSRKVFDVD